jgi:hypothetical protein
MRKKLIIIFMLMLFTALTMETAQSQIVVQLPTPPVNMVQPPWQPIPGVPGVQYVPNLGQDLFRYQNNYYRWHDGRWFQAQSYRGPWGGIQSPPPIFTRIGPQYWKTPPGWAHGNKTGWHGQGLPPGQMKKLQQPVRPIATPYGGGQVASPRQPVPVVAAAGTEGPGKKGGPHGKMKHQGEGWEAVPGGQGGPSGKGRGKFK